MAVSMTDRTGAQDDASQINSGEQIRAAARDYVEIGTLQVSSSADLDALLPTDASNLMASRSESHFKRRFRFDAPEGARAAVLQLKATYGLTDAEVTLARRAGVIWIGRDTAVPRPSRLVMAVGWVFAISTAAIGLLALIVLIWKSPLPLGKTAQLIGVAVLTSATSIASYQIFVRANKLFFERRNF